MIIEQRFHRAIIGQKGEKIKEIRDKFPEASSFKKKILPSVYVHMLKVLCMCAAGLKYCHIFSRSSLIFQTLHIRVTLYSSEVLGLKWRNAQNLCRRWWLKW